MTEMEQVLAEKMPSGNIAARMSEPAVSSTSSCEMQLWLGIIDELQIPEIISDRCQNLNRQLLKALRKIYDMENLDLKFNKKTKQSPLKLFIFQLSKSSPLKEIGKFQQTTTPKNTSHHPPVTTTTINRPT